MNGWQLLKEAGHRSRPESDLCPAPNLTLEFRSRYALNDSAFVVAWEVQSQLATLVLFSLIAFVSIWVALATMLVWSIIAHLIYHHAHERGLPDLFRIELPKRGCGRYTFIRHAAGSAARLWLVGLHNLVFARAACRVMRSGGGDGAGSRIRRAGILGLGMTLFGVTTAEHLLRRAGFTGPALLSRGLIGPFLNVPYRIFLSAAVVHAVVSVTKALCGLGTCLA